MSTHNDDKTKAALDTLTDAQVVELASVVRTLWRQEIAAGKMQLDPKRMRKYDATLKELRQLAGA